MKKALYIFFGILCVIIGGIGIFIPILPTTPLLLLAAWCFLKSSDNLYNWLLNHPVFGLYIKSYIKYKGVERRHKIFAIVMLWSTIIISIANFIDKLWVEALLLVIAAGVTVHILSLKTLTKEEVIELDKYEKELKNSKENEYLKEAKIKLN